MKDAIKTISIAILLVVISSPVWAEHVYTNSSLKKYDSYKDQSFIKNTTPTSISDSQEKFVNVNGNSEISGYVIWKYNDFVGQKSDVGSEVWAFRRLGNGNHYLSPRIFDSNSSVKEKGVYFTTVDLQGKYKISNLPAGIYDLLIVSAATKRNILVKFNPSTDYMAKHTRLMRSYMSSSSRSNKKLQLLSDAISNLNYYHFKEDILKSRFRRRDYKTAGLLALKVNKFEVKFKIKLGKGSSVEINKDFGLTNY